MAITKLQPFNLDTTANYTFANITTDNANLGNASTANFFIGSGNNLSNIQGANVTGAVSSATTSGTVTTNAQPNITSVGTLTGITSTGTVNLTGASNVALGPVANVKITSGSNGQYLQTDGTGNLSWSTVSTGAASNISNGNSNVNIPAANGNINFTAIGNTVMVITGTGVNVAGTLNTGSGIITGNGNGLSSIVGANVTGQVGNSLIAGTVYTNAQPNITSLGTLTDISVSGNGVFGGNLTVNGTLTYINSTTLSISDPIINLQTGPNGAAPVANTGKDVGTALNYYDTSAKISWMGWDVSNAEIAFGSNVSISSEVVTFTSLANIRSGNADLGNNATANYFTGNGVYLTGITLAGLSNGNSNINIPASNGNINFTAVGNANVVVITGTGANISGTANISGNLSAGNIIAGSGSGGNITNANVISANTFTASGNITASNASLGNSVIANYFTGNFYGTANLATYATTANSVAGANVSGEVSYAATANSVAGANVSGAVAYATTANSVAGANVSGAVAYATTANSVAGANVSGQVGNALISGTVYTNAQPNITSVGSLTGLTVSNATGIVDFTTTANVTLGSVSNLHISGGTNAYVLSTDGSGTLSWVAQSGGGGGGASISNGNSNVNIPTANGNINFTAVGNANVVVITGTGANITGTANITGNLSAGNIIAGNGSGGNITNANVISANTFIATGNITAGNADLGNSVIANYFTGNFYGTANTATTAGTVTTNAQPNITSVGTLTSLAVTANGTFGNILGSHANGNSNVNIPASNGNINFTAVGNTIMVITGTGVNVAGTLNTGAGIITGNGSGLSSLAGANVTGAVSFATTANAVAGANVSGEVTYAATANSVAGANVSGQVSNALVSGTVYTNAQPNITSVGSLTGLTISNATGIVDFTNTANVSLGAVGNLKITGGTSAYVLSTDGAGNLSWVAQSGGGGSGASISNGNSNVNIPAANGNVNISAVGNANILVVTGTGANITGTANISGNLSAGNIIAGSGSGGNISNANVISANTFTASGNITAGNANLGNSVIANYFTGNFYGTANTATTAGTVTTNAQPNITSVGSLTGLTISNATGIVDFTTTANVSLGAVANLHISGGTNAYVLSTDGAGTLSWVAQSGGGGGSPGGTDTQVQFNDSSAFGGNAGLTFNKTTTTLTANNFVATSTANLGSNANVIITGGTNGYVLSTNGAGGLSWIASGGGGGGGASISNGTSNVDIATSGGNVTVGVGGTANVVVVSTAGISAAIKPRVVTITDGTTVTMNADTTDMAIQTNTQTAGTLTIAAPTGTLYDGQKLMFRLQSANVQTFSWNAIFDGSTDLTLPITSSGNNKYDYAGFIYNSTSTKWDIIAKNFGF